VRWPSKVKWQAAFLGDLFFLFLQQNEKKQGGIFCVAKMANVGLKVRRKPTEKRTQRLYSVSAKTVKKIRFNIREAYCYKTGTM